MTGIPKRRIGTSGPEVSVLSLGSWHTYDRMDFHAGVDLLRRATELGIDLFDVAVYGGVPVDGRIHYGYSDVLFGRMIERAGVPRDTYKLSVKLWLEDWPDEPLSRQLDRALDRIGTDRAELAVLGDIRTPELNIQALVAELAGLVQDGRLGAWGVGNWAARDIRRAYDTARAASMPGPQLAQIKYGLCRRTVGDGEPYRRLLDDTGITLQASDVFEGGILAGNPHPDRAIGKDPGGIRDKIRGAAEQAARIARDLDATPAQLSIAFCLTNPAISTVLFGASRMEQLEDNVGALDLLNRHGNEIRGLVDGLWMDRDIADPNG